MIIESIAILIGIGVLINKVGLRKEAKRHTCTENHIETNSRGTRKTMGDEGYGLPTKTSR